MPTKSFRDRAGSHSLYGPTSTQATRNARVCTNRRNAAISGPCARQVFSDLAYLLTTKRHLVERVVPGTRVSVTGVVTVFRSAPSSEIGAAHIQRTYLHVWHSTSFF